MADNNATASAAPQNTYWGMTPGQWAGTGLGVGAGIYNSFFNKAPSFQNPADAAMPYFEQAPKAMQPYFQPYIEQGQRAGNALESQYGSMTSNPQDFLSKISQGYQQSPGYQFKMNQALQAANNAAAAGGRLGSPENQFNNEEVGEGLASKDYEDWLNHVLGIYTGGQAGEQEMWKGGMGASTGYGSSLASALMNQGLLKERGLEAENQAKEKEQESESQDLGDIMGFAAKIGAAFL